MDESGEPDAFVTVKIECHCRSRGYMGRQEVGDQHDNQGQESDHVGPFSS